ncbi:uncharacterized protein LOC129234358 [Uloborus diversus]|uniref:uncharacterized protein LOC129234358 n=1 Tax=Uloborus diversus TaxID=327109 RepID=UPI002409A084|nr:uncharacterized protein LOC129234358 [Uloborus diversus]
MVHFVAWLTLLLYVVATSVGQISYHNLMPPHSYIDEDFPQHFPIIRRQMDFGPSSSFIDMLMLGLAGIPVARALGMLLNRNKPLAKNFDDGRVLHNRNRNKRDLAYAQQLLDLLISVEESLERFGVIEPQCQLRATCEIYRRSSNAIVVEYQEHNFIKLVEQMRREIQNPRVVPLAKYVFEYYEEAAIRGEQQKNCKELYSKCTYATVVKRTKGRRPQG